MQGITGRATGADIVAMNDELDLDRFRSLLLVHRDELLRESAETASEREVVELDQARLGRLSRMDALQARAMSQELERRRELELKRIAAALKRLDDGDYGFCLSCGEVIPPKRLEIEPTTTQCIRCASISERGA